MTTVIIIIIVIITTNVVTFESSVDKCMYKQTFIFVKIHRSCSGVVIIC